MRLRPRLRRWIFAILAAASLLLATTVPTSPARANGITDYAMWQIEVGVVTVSILALLGPAIGDTFAHLVQGVANTTDSTFEGSMGGSLLNSDLSITLGGSSPETGVLGVSGGGTYGADDVFVSAHFEDLDSLTAFLVANGFVQVGSNTTSLTIQNQSVSLVPGVTSTVAASVDIEGVVTAFDIDQTFSNVTPGSIQGTAVARLGQDVVIGITQSGSDWAVSVSSVPEPSIALLSIVGLSVASLWRHHLGRAAAPSRER